MELNIEEMTILAVTSDFQPQNGRDVVTTAMALNNDSHLCRPNYLWMLNKLVAGGYVQKDSDFNFRRTPEGSEALRQLTGKLNRLTKYITGVQNG